MSEEQKHLLREFLGEHWSDWQNHCENHGENPDDIYIEILGGED